MFHASVVLFLSLVSARLHPLFSLHKPLFCSIFFEEIISFSDITKDSGTANKIKNLYQERNNVDLWVGGLAEDHEDGSELGETFRM